MPCRTISKWITIEFGLEVPVFMKAFSWEFLCRVLEADVIACIVNIWNNLTKMYFISTSVVLGILLTAKCSVFLHNQHNEQNANEHTYAYVIVLYFLSTHPFKIFLHSKWKSIICFTKFNFCKEFQGWQSLFTNYRSLREAVPSHVGPLSRPLFKQWNLLLSFV